MPRDTGSHAASQPARRISAGVLFTDADRRVLLLQAAHRPTWQIPGGAVPAGESPRAAARRTLREQLGMDAALGTLLVVDWIPPTAERGDSLVFVYDGGTLEDAEARGIRLAAAGLNAYGFVELEGAVGLVSERVERRILAALGARRAGRCVELEDGRPQIARELSPEPSA